VLANAQNVSFTASAKANVAIGEQFPVTYTVNGNGSSFKGPGFEGFRVLTGPNSSTNQSYQIINGKVTQSYQVTYTYYLQGTKEGNFTIASATVTVGGKKYQSNSLKINVVPPTNTKTPSGGNRQSPVSQTGLSDDDVFIKATISRKNPYQGEQSIITYKIYTKVPISQISINKSSSFPGFWYKDLLGNNNQLQQSNEVINGEQFVVATLQRYALFPQRNGEIVIEPLEMECVAQIRTQSNSRSRDSFFDSFFDDPFFNRNVKNIPLTISSNTIKMNVKPLPIKNKASDFSGAVGSFTMKPVIDRTELKANEAINLKITISGKGNIELIDPLEFDFPPDFEVYDPKITNNVNQKSSGVSGSRTFEYLIIPRNAGEFTIKPARFSYFDPQKQDYVSLSTPLYNINVEKGEQEVSGITYSGISQKDIQFIGSDIRHIKSLPFTLSRINTFFFGSLSFYLLIFIPLFLLIAIIIINSFITKRRSNVMLMKNRKATRLAKSKLKKASAYLKAMQVNEFYEEISKALWGYLSDKFNIPLSELSIDTVNDRLSDKAANESTIKEFIDVLNGCEYARFAPGDSSQKMNDIYNDAINIISKIEGELK